jgi:hypothetical protein
MQEMKSFGIHSYRMARICDIILAQYPETIVYTKATLTNCCREILRRSSIFIRA